MSKTKMTMTSVQRVRNIASTLLEDAIMFGFIECEEDSCELITDYDEKLLITFVAAFNEVLDLYEKTLELNKKRKEKAQ